MANTQITQYQSNGTLLILHPETIAELVKYNQTNVKLTLDSLSSQVSTNIENILNVTNIANNALSIAQGRVNTAVFETYTDMITFLEDTTQATNTFFNIGDVIWIKQTNVPDYWISGKGSVNTSTTNTSVKGTTGSVAEDLSGNGTNIVYKNRISTTIGTGFTEVLVSSVSPISASARIISYSSSTGAISISITSIKANTEVTITLKCTSTQSTDLGQFGYYNISELETRTPNLEPYQTKQLTTALSINNSTYNYVEEVLTAIKNYVDGIVNGTTAVANATNATNATKANKADQLVTARTISLSGDATGSISFDGSSNKTLSVTLANSGVTAGTYSVVTVDAKGRATSGGQIIEVGAANQTTPSSSLAVGGIFFKVI